MKKILIVLLLSSSTVFAQKETIEKLNYEQTQDINFFVNVKQNTPLKEYITKSGNSIKIGDTLIIGDPTTNSTNTRVVNSGYGIAIANTTTRKQFEFIQLGRPAGFGSVMNKMNGQAPDMAGINLKGESVVVHELKAYHKGSKKKPLEVIIVIGEINGRAFGINKFLSAMDTESAIELGELYLKNRKMTREEAISKLKESKDLLDLGLLTNEEYEKLKLELTPIIIQK